MRSSPSDKPAVGIVWEAARECWRAYVRVNGTLKPKRFPPETPIAVMVQWRDDHASAGARAAVPAGSFAADVAAYLPRIAAKATAHQIAAHLELWLDALGRDRRRSSITAAEIDAVIQRWLVTPSAPANGAKGRPSAPKGISPGTCRKRRTSLLGLFRTLDGKQAANPVRAAANPKPPKPEARALTYPQIRSLLDAMPTTRSGKPGAVPVQALGKLRAAVIAFTGLPPHMLAEVKPSDLSLRAGTIRVAPRQKGAGVEARTLPLTPDGLEAFRAFHAANAYGRFAVQPLNLSVQRAGRRAGIDRAFTLYDLRHSFGTALYRQTKDLATVARFMLHSEGSPITPRYAMGANADVDRAAAAAFKPDAGAAKPRKVRRAS